jgi:uncharacterized membrane protein YphA (DoxX/SURF4 family)
MNQVDSPPSQWTWKRVHYLLSIPISYYLAYTFFVYGVAKLTGSQFTPGELTLDTPVRDLSGFSLVWVYHGFSKPFAYLLGVIEILAGVLLLFDRTRRVGALLYAMAAANIVLVNTFFTITSTTMVLSLVLLGLSFFLLLPDLPVVWRFLFESQQEQAHIPPLFKRYQPALVFIGVVFTIGFVWYDASWMIASRKRVFSEVSGSYDVMSVGKGTVAPFVQWKRIYVLHLGLFEARAGQVRWSGRMFVSQNDKTFRLRLRQIRTQKKRPWETISGRYVLEQNGSTLRLSGTDEKRPFVLVLRKRVWKRQSSEDG